MLLHQILNLDNSENLFIPEDGYSELKDMPQTLRYMEQMLLFGETGLKIKGLKDDKGLPVCLAVYNSQTDDYPAFWIVFTCLVAKKGAVSFSAGQFDDLASGLQDLTDDVTWVESASHDLEAALREYYSIVLVNQQLCNECIKPSETYEMVFLDGRVRRLNELLEKLDGKIQISGNMLEICCGNGMATLALEGRGMYPLTVDYDRCEVCQGLEHGVLKPERTIVLDAAKLSLYFPENSFDAVMGFMLGTIYNFNKDIWIAIMDESVKVLRPGGSLLFTVNRKDEMDILQQALDGAGASGEVIDNTDDNGIYDQWVYMGRKEVK